MLYCVVGVMRSGKTKTAIETYNRHTMCGDKVMFLVPSLLENKDGIHKSRVGTFVHARYVSKKEKINELCKDYDVIIVDECQFLSTDNILEIRELADEKLVYCYGLKTTVTNDFFDATLKLLLVADKISSITGNLCDICQERPSAMNVLFDDQNNIIRQLPDGFTPPLVDGIETDSLYHTICHYCWRQ